MKSRLLFISHQTEDYSYLDSIRIALQGGCKLIQLRMKEASDEEVTKVGQKAKVLCSSYNATLTVDDRVEVAKSLKLAGVHLGLQDMRIDAARAVLGSDALIGGTANELADMLEHQKRGANYIGLGPYRFTKTKQNLSPTLGLQGYTQLVKEAYKQGMYLPIYAIGGITLEDIPLLMKTGIWGISLSSTILNATDPVKQTERIIETINNSIDE